MGEIAYLIPRLVVVARCLIAPSPCAGKWLIFCSIRMLSPVFPRFRTVSPDYPLFPRVPPPGFPLFPPRFPLFSPCFSSNLASHFFFGLAPIHP